MKSIRAVYEDGVFKPTEPVALAEHSEVEIGDIRVIEMPAKRKAKTVGDLSRFEGILKDLPIDPMEFQRQIREEWD